jgi:hypothetical protein
VGEQLSALGLGPVSVQKAPGALGGKAAPPKPAGGAAAPKPAQPAAPKP